MRKRATTLVAVCALALAVPTVAQGNHYAHRNARIICKVFGPYCKQALSVAWCESRLTIWAHNGQYLGLFQMGSWERRTYGHGNDAWTQSRAAYRYFVASGRDWSPWSCRP